MVQQICLQADQNSETLQPGGLDEGTLQSILEMPKLHKASQPKKTSSNLEHTNSAISACFAS